MQRVLVVISDHGDPPQPSEVGAELIRESTIVVGLNRHGTNAVLLKRDSEEDTVSLINHSVWAASRSGATMLLRVAELEAQVAELQHHSSRLVELLHDAWWVEAAQHLKELSDLTREGA